MEETFRTLRGFLAGSEPYEKTYFAYSASLRIFGDIPNLEEISSHLGFQPTNTHRKGDTPGPQAPEFHHDMWSYSPSVDKSERLERHIDALWEKLKPHKKYLLELKKSLAVDVFLGYRSNCDHAGIEVPHASLEMFAELEIPLRTVDHHCIRDSRVRAPAPHGGSRASKTLPLSPESPPRSSTRRLLAQSCSAWDAVREPGGELLHLADGVGEFFFDQHLEVGADHLVAVGFAGLVVGLTVQAAARRSISADMSTLGEHGRGGHDFSRAVGGQRISGFSP
jgi:hypothetical protein